MTVTKKSEDTEVSITPIVMTKIMFRLVGESPLVPHAVSFKAKGQLLFPSKKKNQAEKDSSMKHDPYQEFIDAAYKFRDQDDRPTRLYMPGTSFHSALANAAIDMAGAKKAQIGRLTSVIGDIAVYGVPQIHCSIVRSSDMARTPDVRTLPILPEWAACVTIQFVESLIKPASIANLLAAAGLIIGVGDGRPEKGKLDRGKFRIVNEGDADFDRIVKAGGRKAQDAAMAAPLPFNLETEELLSWFTSEKDRRIAAPAKTPKKANGGRTAESVADAIDARHNG